MYSRDKLFTRSLECYFGVHFPRCRATREINTKITLSWARKQFACREHTSSFYMYPHDDTHPHPHTTTHTPPSPKVYGSFMKHNSQKVTEMYWGHTENGWRWCDAMGRIDTARLPDEPCMSLINSKYGSSVMHSTESHMVRPKPSFVMNSSA